MNITESLEMHDLGLYHADTATFIFGDVHVGYEEAMNKQGYMTPRFQFSDLKKRFEDMISGLNIDVIVINGDLKHEFGTISEQEWRDTLKFLDLCSEHAKNVVLVKGNHDTILDPIAGKRDIEIVDSYIFDDIMATHGDDVPEVPDDVSTIIISHEHPAIGLREGKRIETFKCFLKGPWKKKTLIVLPSFHQLYEGANLLREKTLSPFFLLADIDRFTVYLIGEDGAYDFGTFGKLKKKV